VTPDKVFQPSTETDYNVNDLASGDETDNEDNPRKQIPKWAEKDNLRSHVQKLFRTIKKDAINSYFGVLEQPKIDELFFNTSKTYDHLQMNETTAWESPIANPRPALSAANPVRAKH
jgi:inner centromere protein